MPPTRRKSCLACIRTKRKCDQGLPSCQRCLAVKRICEYVDRKPRIAQSTLDSDHAFTGLDSEDVVVGAAADMQEWQLQSGTSYRSLPGILSPLSDHAIFDFPNHPFNFPGSHGSELLDSGFIEDIVSQQDMVATRTTPSNPSVQARVEFAARRLAAIPSSFAAQGQAIFIHRMLFQRTNPPALQDALSTCALYSLKNSSNQILVFQNIEQKHNQLVASINPLNASTSDLLAAVQAFLLYQIIRLFDGDIRMRAQAETDEALFGAWTLQLSTRVRQLPACQPSAGGRSSITTTVPNWHRWLIEESSRRTLIVAYMLKGVYDFLKTGFDVNRGFRVTFTAQAGLWGAQSESSWQRVLSEKAHLEIHVAQWDLIMGKAEPEDLEELGVLVMAMLWGVDRTAMWLGQNHAARYGFEEIDPACVQLLL